MDFKNLYDDFEVVKIPSPYTNPTTCGAYVIEHKDGLYIGSSDDLYRRQSGHKSKLNCGKHGNKNLQAAYDKDPNYTMKFLVTESRDEAYAVEQHLIDEMMPYGVLFNLSPDARLANKGLTHTFSEEARRKMSEAHIGRTYAPFSDAHRENLRLAHLGKTLDDEHKDKILMNSPKRQTVVIEGNEYPSMRQAGKALGLDHAIVRKRVLSDDDAFSEWTRGGQP